jgi:hypothetical protein
MTHFRQTAILATIAALLLGGATTANAQTTVITREPAQTQTIVTEQPLRLAPVQRRTIYRTIVRERVLPARPTVEYRVGMRVPQTARIYTVPETVAVEVPAIKTYKYMMVNNRIVLIDPATSEVVDEFTD